MFKIAITSLFFTALLNGIEIPKIGEVVLPFTLSNQFNKMLVVPVQDTPHELIGKIKNTNKFMIAEGPQLRLHDEDSIDLPQPNHMRQENHDIMFNMLVDWIENNTVFNTEKLIKITHDYSNEHQDVFGGIYDSTK